MGWTEEEGMIYTWERRKARTPLKAVQVKGWASCGGWWDKHKRYIDRGG